MPRPTRTLRRRLGAGIAAAGLLAAGCLHSRPDADGCAAGDCPPVGHLHRQPAVCVDPTVHSLAEDLDHLERHVDWYGSAVAKVPDVWGQARLTHYREEFEAQMALDAKTFEATLSGSLARSDQAFFAQTLALGLAAQPRPPVIGRVSGDKAVTVPQLVTLSEQVVTTSSIAPNNTSTTTITRGLAPTAPASPPPPPPATIPVPTPQEVTVGTTGSLTDLTPATFGGFAAGGVTIEPELRLAQKARYLDFLNQLRRTNEGDDKADAPGYSLNLMRIPVSLLPGKRTDVGHGAEVTFTVEPVIGPDLLKTTFRNLMTNDLLRQLGFPLALALNDPEVTSILTTDTLLFLQGRELIARWAALPEGTPIATGALTERDQDRLRAALAAGEPGRLAELQDNATFERELAEAVRQERWAGRLSGLNTTTPPPTDPALPPPVKGAPKTPESKLANRGIAPLAMYQGGAAPRVAPDARAAIQGQAQAAPSAPTPTARFAEKLRVPNLSFANGLDNKVAYPTSQLLDVLGETNCFLIAHGAWLAQEDAIRRQGYAHLPDIQSYLREEVQAAHQFLSQPTQAHLWGRFCTPELVSAVRSRQIARLAALREEFRAEVERLTLTDEFRRRKPDYELMHFSRTAALAWAVLVDAALLNDRLNRDVRESASAKGKPFPHCADGVPFFLPEPPAEAADAFAHYVRLR